MKFEPNLILLISPSSSRRVLNLVFVFCRDVQVGDVVTVGECRPLSKTVKFNTLKVTKAQGNKKSFKKF